MILLRTIALYIVAFLVAAAAAETLSPTLLSSADIERARAFCSGHGWMERIGVWRWDEGFEACGAVREEIERRDRLALGAIRTARAGNASSGKASLAILLQGHQ